MNVETMTNKTCCGCTACLSACPVNAITMEPDANGFEIPAINAKLCIDCGKCAKVCASLEGTIRKNDHLKTYGAYSDNDSLRKESSSGAFFPSLANKILNEGGYICGCILDTADMKVKHVVTNDVATVRRMSDSKYVQSSMGFCYREIANLLKQGLYVLFTGTSCQVNGLISYLENIRISTEKLITVDLICHGVPSPLIYREYLDFYEREKGKKVTDMKFRTKLYGWSPESSFIQQIICDGESDTSSFAARLWQNCFFSDLCLRTYCHQCPYTTVNKPSDITIGDFWGVDHQLPKFTDTKGCSIILVHTEKGEQWFDSLGMVSRKVEPKEDAARFQANLSAPSPKAPDSERFWEDYHAHGFDYVAQHYLCYTRKNVFRYFLSRKLFSMGRRGLARKMAKGILL